MSDTTDTEKLRQDVGLNDIYMLSSSSFLLCSLTHNRLCVVARPMTDHLNMQAEENIVLYIF